MPRMVRERSHRVRATPPHPSAGARYEKDKREGCEGRCGNTDKVRFFNNEKLRSTGTLYVFV